MKTIMIIIAIFLSVNLFGQIKNSGSVEMGWKQGIYTIHQNDLFNARFTYPGNTFYTDINLLFTWKIINFEQDIFTNFCYKQGKTFSPIDIEFVSRFFIKCGKFSAGYEHSCLHPIISEKENLDANWRRANYDKIFFKFEW